MDDEQIDALATAIKAGPVWWVCDGTAKRCTCVVREWIEQFSDGAVAYTEEPAVYFADGTMAALWFSDASEFVRFVPAFHDKADLAAE